MSWGDRPAEERNARLHRQEVPGQARDRRGEHESVQGRLGLRRDERGLPGHVRGRPGRPPAGHLPQHPRQPGADARADRRVGQERPPALPRRLPDHAGVGDPRGPFAPQGLRRPDLPGGGRDLRRRRRTRCELRRRARRLYVERPRHCPEDGDDRPRCHARAAARDHRRPAGGPVHGDADQARAGRPPPLRCGAGTPSRRCR